MLAILYPFSEVGSRYWTGHYTLKIFLSNVCAKKKCPRWKGEKNNCTQFQRKPFELPLKCLFCNRARVSISRLHHISFTPRHGSPFRTLTHMLKWHLMWNETAPKSAVRGKGLIVQIVCWRWECYKQQVADICFNKLGSLCSNVKKVNRVSGA